MQHQLQAIGLLQKKGRSGILCPLPDTAPSASADELSKAVYAILNIAHFEEKSFGKPPCPRVLLTMLLEEINGPPPSYPSAMAGLEKQEQEKIKKGNQKLCDWIENVFVKNANEEAKKIGLDCAVEDLQLGTSTNHDQTRFWRHLYTKAEEHRNK